MRNIFDIIIVNQKIWDKDIKSLSKQDKENIKTKILALKNFPNAGDIKKLTNFTSADYRLRIGHYRVLFDLDHCHKKILLYRILHRKDSYSF
ncbi:plasmid stabilization protein [Candidatus Peregrinibacteria bacterium]|nr:MAG: plasmid stabilization protein [Candidatus Peregrinibacteria bacterium]